MEDKKVLLNYIDRLSVIILGMFLLIFPLAFTTITTDPFSIPKEIVLAVATLPLLLLLGGRFVIEGSVKIRRTPFDLPIILFTAVVLISSILSRNMWDSLTAFVPLFLSVLLFFTITNFIKRQTSLYFIVGMLGLGGALLSIISVLSYLKIYVFPMDFARTQTFNLFGSLFDQAIYLIIVFSVCAYLTYPLLKTKARDLTKSKAQVILAIFSLITLLGVAVSILSVIKLQPTPILPPVFGFQIGVAAISQDSGRVLKGLLFGSGFGTFFSDFTRFRPIALNANNDLWTISFFRSSDFLLELLATTGILGLISYIFIFYRALKVKPLFVPIIVVGLLSFLPLSLASETMIFVVLGIFAAFKELTNKNKQGFFDIELHLVAFKKGLFSITETESRETSPHAAKALSVFVFAILAIVAVVIGYFMVTFTLSDITFQKSFISISQNNGSAAYDQQSKAISYFPNRDGYQRIFSQLNLTIANNLASSIPQGSSPSAQQQQTIYTLIQQSINSARQATTVSPLTVTDWQNLSSVYRSLIGFGQNADSFAVVAAQQSASLDPNNPQEYINLGGIFYQLGQWDNAITQFQTAANLKPDYANAYYNLGHAYQQKGDLKNALVQYQTVKSLIGNDPTNLAKINSEIDAVQKDINSQASGETPTAPSQELNVSQPPVQLPAQPSPVKIPGPNVSATPAPSASPSPTASPELNQ